MLGKYAEGAIPSEEQCKSCASVPGCPADKVDCVGVYLCSMDLDEVSKVVLHTHVHARTFIHARSLICSDITIVLRMVHKMLCI